MKISLWSIGKPHDPLLKEAIEDFTKRLRKYFAAEWVILPPVRNAGVLPEEALKKAEAQMVLAALQKDDFLVLLDERGSSFSSEALAQFLQQRANQGTRRLVFLIGGAFGVDASVKEQASHTWSLSQLVFPHMIVRLLLAEQLYRACTILKNEKYHHS